MKHSEMFYQNILEFNQPPTINNRQWIGVFPCLVEQTKYFAYYVEYYLLDKEKLNITLQEVEPFDELCIIVYMEHKELINSYFDELFQQVHEQTSSETNDNEFDDALYLIDAEYNSRNITL